MNALARCLEEESNAILSASKKLDNNQVELALELINRCSDKRGKLIISGVGKSGIVGRKIAATFCSIGLISVYLNPLDALHGDLGIVDQNDVCILLSNSGNTQELLDLIIHLKNRKVDSICIVGNSKSALAENCKVILEAGVDKEVCPLNLAPTASTAVAMAIGDAIAAVWMERRKISQNDFAFNHPAGSLGKKLTLKVENVMIPLEKVHLLNSSNTLVQIISVITKDGIGSGIVVNTTEKKQLLGVITDGDLRRSLEKTDQSKWDTITASDIMSRNPITVKPETFIIDALNLMENNPKKAISMLPVIDVSNRLLGLLRLHDVLQAGV